MSDETKDAEEQPKTNQKDEFARLMIGTAVGFLASKFAKDAYDAVRQHLEDRKNTQDTE